MLLDLFISDGNDAGWFLLGVLLTVIPVIPIVLIVWLIGRAYERSLPFSKAGLLVLGMVIAVILMVGV
jgi:hypothetical protein